MSKRLQWAAAIAVAVLIGACAVDRPLAPPQSSTGRVLHPDSPREWVQYQLAQRAPMDGSAIPVDAYARAEASAAKMRRYSAKSGAFIDAAVGAKATAPRWEFLGPNNVAGRTRTLEFDPRDPNRMLAGGVSGGVWVSTDAGGNWTPLSDNAANINIGALLIDPVQPDIIYAGTGELYRNNEQPYSAMWGQGILRSTDGGTTFQQLLATANDNFRYVADLAISRRDHRRIYAATNTGLWRSDNGGASFTQVLRPVDGNGALRYEGCNDLQVLPDAANDVVLAACSSRSTDDRYYLPGTILPPACVGPCPAALFLNTDAAGSGAWQSVLSEAGMGRTTVDYARSAPNIVYAISASIVSGFDRTGDGEGDYDNGLHAVWRSDDGGRTWEARVRNNSANALSTYLLGYADGYEAVRCGFGQTSVYNAGWYNQAIAVNPLNPEIVWVAGMEHYRSNDGGRTFGKASYWWHFGADSYGVHADQHLLKFHPQYDGVANAKLYTTNDGGIAVTDEDFRSVRRDANAACGPSDGMVSWRTLTNGLGTSQFYTGAVTPDGATYLGGLQDNGTVHNTSAGADRNWNHIFDGDGGQVAIDPRNRNVIYATSQYVAVSRSMDGGATFVNAHVGLVDNPIFIMPYLLDPSAPDRLYAGATRVWRTDNQGRAWRQISAAFGSQFAQRVSAIAVAPTAPNYMLAGNQTSIRYTRAALTATPTTVWGEARPRTGWVSSLVFDPVDQNVAYATYSTFGGEHVWRSADAGTTWTAIDGAGEGRLPDVPVHTLAIDPGNRDRLFIGTDIGVFVSLDRGQHWAVENTGFANTITELLTIANGDASNPPRLYAFTYGRGAWRVPLGDLTGVADYRIGPDLTGAFFDPTHSGHGWLLETINIDGATGVLAAWYVYLNGEQRWLIGTGVATGNTARLSLSIARGGGFPPAFDPAAVSVEPWGEVLLTFDDRDHGRARWTPNYPGYSAGEMPLSRLSQPAVVDAPLTAGSVNACHSGTWFNVAQSGHGFMVEVLGTGTDRQALIVWYVYLNGQQRWLIGQGPIVGDTATVDVLTASGGNFPPNFDPATVQLQSWGTLRFRPTGANTAHIDWTSTLPGFNNGALDVERLTSVLGRECR